jgi:hypothetical protein
MTVLEHLTKLLAATPATDRKVTEQDDELDCLLRNHAEDLLIVARLCRVDGRSTYDSGFRCLTHKSPWPDAEHSRCHVVGEALARLTVEVDD